MNQRMPFILLGIILFSIFFDPYLPLTFKSTLLALSLSIKSVIIFVLPFVIFGLLFSATSNLSARATRIIGFVLLAICASNFVATLLGRFVGEWVYHFNLSIIPPHAEHALIPAWTFDLPKLISNGQAMMAGLISGLVFSRLSPKMSLKVAGIFESFIDRALKILGYFIPLFIAGFAIKLQHEGVITTIIHDYSFIFATIAVAQFTYIFFLYFVLSRFNFSLFIERIKNMLPAGISGLCTMSSAASIGSKNPNAAICHLRS
ncbi:MAG: dicarboxylate/amino acid:cation symporter, partial [Pseudomonadota bacterium]